MSFDVATISRPCPSGRVLGRLGHRVVSNPYRAPRGDCAASSTCSRQHRDPCCSWTRRAAGAACSPNRVPTSPSRNGRPGNLDAEPTQGSLADFVAEEARALGSPRVILSHHDDWLPGFAGAPDTGPVRRALESLDPPAGCSSWVTSTQRTSFDAAALRGSKPFRGDESLLNASLAFSAPG